MEGKGERTAGKTKQSEDRIRDGNENSIHISVRSLVEFILRHGDIDNRRHMSPDNAMQEGGRIHRMIQRRMGAEYRAEVPLKCTFPTDLYTLTVEGRADGIFSYRGKEAVDEIKGTYRDIARIKAPMPLHIAQAKCYAYMYGLQQGLREMCVRVTYCNIPTEEMRYFYEEYSFAELQEWFENLITAYRKWADYSFQWRGVRQASIEELSFPYSYRQGQRELVAGVYRTIYHKKKLFLEAPTGVGKTISTVYPSIQAMGKGMGEKIFYLTAKTITRTVAEETFDILREKGLRLKSVILTAKEKICFMEETECNPEYCPYARGHYDRINDAVFDLLTSQESFRREQIEEYARRHMVCPFEMCLDMSLFADAVIGDYNYLFDPHVYLKRFFGDNSESNYIFLVDEAHNLLERSREMYSASLWKEQFLELRREIKQTIVSEEDKRGRKTGVAGQIEIKATLFMTETSEHKTEDEEENENIDQVSTARAGAVSNGKNAKKSRGRSILVWQGYGEKIVYHLGKCNQELLALKRECERYRIVEDIDEFVRRLMRLQSAMEDYLGETEEAQLSIRDDLLNFYFEICHFLAIYELQDENYIKYTQMGDDNGFLLKLFCVNPGENLKKCMMRGRSTILFSATFLPIQYYKKLLGGEQEDYEIYAQSVFDPGKRALFIAGDVTSKFTRRSEEEYFNIARYIEEIVKNRHGNYMVFCPSYAFLRVIYEKYMTHFAGAQRECIVQGEAMREADREIFLERFRRDQAPGVDGSCGEICLIGFCVLGGIFGEGIDLKRDSLIGAIIVGTGLPQVCDEKEILRMYFEEGEESGFDYAYRYPGMNKVLQAAGRVIRTVEDVGIIALLDERFLQPAYRRLFPREWRTYETVTVNTVAKRVERFWNEWL